MLDQRPPSAAGSFYPDQPAAYARGISECFASVELGGNWQPARAAILPHAGWRYSGRVVGETLARAQVPSRAVILCPNHTGRGSYRAVTTAARWNLPIGSVEVDRPLAAEIRSTASLDADDRAHAAEHAIEVLLPLLRHVRPDVSIVPICLGPLSMRDCFEIGSALGRVLLTLANDESRPLLIASTDFSHYLPAEEAERLDALAIDRIRALDPQGLFEVVRTMGISMCGVVPTTVVLKAAIDMGAVQCHLVRYTHSGAVTNDRARVVGYAGMLAE